jgi:hypothetical protein
VPDEKHPIPKGAKAREVKTASKSQYQRDTMPPSPEKAAFIETAINKEVLTLLDTVAERTDGDEEGGDVPSVPPPEKVTLEKIEEGVQYRIVEPASELPESSAQAGTDKAPSSPSTGNADLDKWKADLESLERELREREERVLQQEVMLGGREKILKQREAKLQQREVRLRNWEAKLMDKEAELRESYPPERKSIEQVRPEPETPPAPEPVRASRASDFRIEIGGGSGVWEMIEEPVDESGDDS